MPQEPLDAEIKTRVPKQHKLQLEKIATARHLKLSDILREAVREKLALKRSTSPAQRAA